MRYSILGSIEVSAGERVVPVRTGRQRAVLAILLLHANETVSMDRLVDALWGDEAPPTARKVVQNAVSQLRKTLDVGPGEPALLTEGRGYRLRVDAGELDAERFEALLDAGRRARSDGDPAGARELLCEALALWRGPPFADAADDAFAQSEVARLEELRLMAVEERIDADLALGLRADLVAELEALSARNPLRERLAGQWMLALYRDGRQPEALDVYQRVRRGLVGDLGLEPGPALRRLHEAILRQDSALELPTRESIAAEGVRRRSSGARRIAVAGAVLVVVAGAAALAVMHDGGSSAGLSEAAGNSLVAIDPATNRIVAEVPVGAAPINVAVGAGAAWTLSADEGTVSRVEFGAKTVRTVATGAVPIDLTVGGGALWVVQAKNPGGPLATTDLTNTPAALARLDPLSGVARATIALPVPTRSAFVAQRSQLVAVAGGAVWAIGTGGWVHRLDLRSGHLSTRRSVGRLDNVGLGIATGDGQLWIHDFKNVVRLGLRSGRVLSRVAVPTDYLSAMAVGAGAVWLTAPGDGAVWRVDPKRLVARTIAVEPGVDSIAVGAGAVWAANSVRGTVDRIDPTSNRVTAHVVVGNTPRAVAVAQGRVWVAVAGGGRGALPAGGALRAGARVKALSAPPCGRVLAGPDGDPDVLIASDLPLRTQLGTTLRMSAAVAFVLRQHRFRAGRYRVGYQSCDDATAQTGVWDDGKCRDNARTYTANPAVVGVVGPLNSGCAAAMLPILNQARGGPLAVVSPTNSAPDLVRPDPGALRHLYPTGQRGYARVYPSDDYEAAAGAILAKRLGHGTVYFLEDRDFSSGGPWRGWFRRAADRIGLRVVGTAAWRVRAHNYRRLAERVRASGAGAVYLNTLISANLGRVLRDLRAVLGPRVPIIGMTGFLPISILIANGGRAAEGVHITSPGLLPDRLDAAGRRFVRDFGATQRGHRVTNFDVYAAAATEVLLNAIARSDGTRASVTRALAATKLDDSPLGPLALDRNGELTSSPVTVVRVERGGGDPNQILGVDGGVTEDVITPPARLVAPSYRIQRQESG